MLTSDVKRRIDAARDVLVGVAPNPTTQIEQITFALIYKFMHDMDQSAVKAGGEASFFTGTLKKYSWDKVLDSRLGNHEKLALYAEALEKFTEAKQLPELFRSIFRSAYLPYKSPETLGLFLKEMNHFDYTHPEELGNAYEYLLSIMSSQGDAGQFRTPRHIIDFIVDVVNPSKDDRILDPACGTGGFLISSYKHILEQHDGKNDPKKKEKLLTPDDRKKLMANLEGYDIDPTMVRIAQVNMYLHQFKNPQIFQYDTLTSEERWNDKYDVILANPPFMSPRGGIRPHNKFGVTSNRAEVLFIDYIVNHLKPKGRAGIIVPEGIIFQSGNAYKALRKNLVGNGLYAVVSLPGGVFQPYSGVKTSILLVDNELAKKKSEIAFVKISADGFDLGSTKRPTAQNDLPEALELLQSWVAGVEIENPLISFVSRGEIASKGNYSLSGEGYKAGVDHSMAIWPVVKLGEITEILDSKRKPITKSDRTKGPYPYYGATGIVDYVNDYIFDERLLLLGEDGAKWEAGQKSAFIIEGKCWVNNHAHVLRPDSSKVVDTFLMNLLNYMDLSQHITGVTVPKLNQEKMREIRIPLPPLDVQQQLVAELDGFDAIISGAKQIIENWKPNIEVDPEWDICELGEICEFINGDRSDNYPTNRTQDSSGIPFINAGNLNEGKISMVGADFITEDQFKKIGGGKIQVGDVLFCLRGSLGKMALNIDISKGAIASSLIILRAKLEKVEPLYLYTVLASSIGQNQIAGQRTGAAQPNLAAGNLKKFRIPLPAKENQKEIVDAIRAEEFLIQSAKQIVDMYEARKQVLISKLWNSPLEVD